MSVPVTDLGDQAASQLTVRYMGYQALRLDDLPMGRHVLNSAAHEANALIDMVGVTEVFLKSRLAQLDPGADTRNWETTKESWATHHVDLEDEGAFPHWLHVRGFVEARNALLHRGGRLTPYQLKHRERTLQRLRAAELVLLGDRVVIDEQAVDDSYVACFDLVVGVDRSAPR